MLKLFFCKFGTLLVKYTPQSTKQHKSPIATYLKLSNVEWMHFWLRILITKKKKHKFGILLGTPKKKWQKKKKVISRKNP